MIKKCKPFSILIFHYEPSVPKHGLFTVLLHVKMEKWPFVRAFCKNLKPVRFLIRQGWLCKILTLYILVWYCSRFFIIKHSTIGFLIRSSSRLKRRNIKTCFFCTGKRFFLKNLNRTILATMPRIFKDQISCTGDNSVPSQPGLTKITRR